MKALLISLYSKEQAQLPLAYGQYIQGALYACLVDRFPQIHEEGYQTAQGRRFRMFTFGPIQGASHIDVQHKTITLHGGFTIEVRSAVDEVVDEIAAQLCDRRSLRLASHTFSVVGLEERRQLVFPDRCMIRMASPVTVHVMTSDRHTRYLSPLDEDFHSLVQANAQSKMKAAGIPGNGSAHRA